MSWNRVSLLGLVGLVASFVWLYYQGSLFGTGPVTIAIQVAAALLMLWARLSFGLRSFHASANPTAGGLVKTGPYRYIRHPIYAALLYFIWTGVLSHPSLITLLAGLVASAMAAVRMFAEETLLVGRYPEYRDYARTTARVIPFIF